MTDTPRGLSRRLLLAASAVGAAATASALVATPALAAPNYSVIPRLPGEVSRLDTVRSESGGKPYEVIDVKIGNDPARLFVPHSAVPGKNLSVPVVWYYHASGSDWKALSGAYKNSAEKLVDQGFVSICPQYSGSSAYTSAPALAAQKAAVEWVTSQWSIRASFLRSNSGGGALLCWAYANRLVPNIYGAYHASGVYNIEDTEARDPGRVLAAYGGNVNALRAGNPSRLPQSLWTGTRLRITAGSADTLVPAELHGGRLRRLAQPVARETTIAYHSGDGGQFGHVVPPFTNNDMVQTFRRWLQEGPA
ncbi:MULTISPECIES: hypothetical protein [unclassified Rathayibacter]|uniref:hypothetical protein n=1 Tax=unclassified Rathayibacter TaxID=2609250 RepID=UPI000CE7FC80|nr:MULTISPECIES: hypothetical protein [unclassified Rathayibacter]PPF34202.1 hypothetical protein C5B93_12820 [Rathayibacter sp. AY1A2]PPG32511.1 hypothetical protein C5C25_05430 [Rathayibacter sp. AY2B9]PPH89513.1 hypothetical protein C5C82_07660 [Rathayibacter sp. AY1D5]PPI05942.1 hypothetical protein C5C63_12340 [Rathayibacter sp. AY1B8]PPI18419.1 hypothetical protein C5D04_01890 [Rathayibacter sp. AY1D2]